MLDDGGVNEEVVMVPHGMYFCPAWEIHHLSGPR